MAAVATQAAERCTECGCLLSRYRDPDEDPDRCAPCAREARPSAGDGELRILPPEPLMLAVAGLLITSLGLAPGQRLHVQDTLAALGVYCDADDAHHAVEKLRRRYAMVIEATEREAGYCLAVWPYEFRRLPRTGQLRLFR